MIKYDKSETGDPVKWVVRPEQDIVRYHRAAENLRQPYMWAKITGVESVIN